MLFVHLAVKMATGGTEPLNINQATEAQLKAIHSISNACAVAIIQFREEHDGYLSEAALLSIPTVPQKMVSEYLLDGVLYAGSPRRPPSLEASPKETPHASLTLVKPKMGSGRGRGV